MPRRVDKNAAQENVHASRGILWTQERHEESEVIFVLSFRTKDWYTLFKQLLSHKKMEEFQRYEESSMYKERQSCSLRRLGDMVPARVVLYMLSFSGFLVSFMMRTDINIAMVAMAKIPSTMNNETIAASSHCYIISNASHVENKTIIRPEEDGEFEWSPAIQSAILSSFYWCYILSQMLGGVLTQYFGTKTIFGGSQVVTAVCSLLMPTAAKIHYGAMIALRSIQGIASGLTWPAMYAVIGHWIPPVERSRFMSSFQG